MEDNKSMEVFAKAPIRKAVLQNALPAMAAMLMVLIYNLADTFFIFYVLTNALQARGAATESLIVNISRQGLIYIPSMFILGAIFHETGLIWAQPVADVLSLLLALVLYMRNSKRLTGKKIKKSICRYQKRASADAFYVFC